MAIYWHSTCCICCYSICDICWYDIHNIHNFIIRNHRRISNTFKILPILANTCARILTIIVLHIIFTLTLTCFIIPFLLWITCCTIEFPFTSTWNMFYHCFTIVLASFIIVIILNTLTFMPPACFSPVTSINVGISPKNFLNFSFKPFATLL